MSVERAYQDDPRLLAAAAELREMIAARYPGATFEVTRGDDPVGLYLIPTVDVDDTEDVAEVVADRLLVLQVDDELPIYVFPVRPLIRVLAEASANRTV
jgi:hypothetical protein